MDRFGNLLTTDFKKHMHIFLYWNSLRLEGRDIMIKLITMLHLESIFMELYFFVIVR